MIRRPNKYTKWYDFKEALRLMQAGDPPLTWDVVSIKTAREYATRICRGTGHRYSIEAVRDLPNCLIRIKVSRVERVVPFA